MIYHYKDLPKNGLIASFDVIEAGDSIIFTNETIISPSLVELILKAMEKRRDELGCNIEWKDLPPSTGESRRVEFKFVP